MAVQDDRREIEQRELFELMEPDNRSRDGVDGILEVDGEVVEFELKSTTKDSVTTVRDFGMDHIRKWENKHWLFGFYTPQGKALKFTRYASPRMMAAWIEEKRSYVEPDYRLAKLASSHLTLEDLFAVCGEKENYLLQDAKCIQKKQLSKEGYLKLQDVDGGYSQGRMSEGLKMRCEYVMGRGSRLSNAHIPKGVLEKFPMITYDHGSQLRELVRQELKT